MSFLQSKIMSAVFPSRRTSPFTLLPAYPTGTEKQIVVTTGKLVVEFHNTKEYFDTGDALFVQADASHTFINQTAEPCGYFMVISRHM